MTKLTYDPLDEQFICVSDQDSVPRNAFFEYDGRHHHWYTKKPTVAARLRPYADRLAREMIDSKVITVKPWPGRIPYPKRETPMPWQLQGAKWGLERNRSYLGIDPRLGKTPIGAMMCNAEGSNAIWICQASLCETIRATLQKWLLFGLTAGKFSYPMIDKRPNIMLVPDSKLDRDTTIEAVKAFVKDAKFNNRPVRLFVDEAHRFKNLKNKRTRYLFNEIVPLFEKITFLSGTPMPNRPFELWPILLCCAHDVIDYMTEWQFKFRYCGPEKISFTKRDGKVETRWNFLGFSNMKELGEKVKDKFMLRIKRSDVKLPPKIEEIVIIDDDLPPYVSRLDQELVKMISPRDLLKRGQHTAAYRKGLGLAKVSHAIKFIKELLEDTNENLLVVAHHKAVIQKLILHLPALVIDGSTPTHKRAAVEQEFLTNDKNRLLIINEEAGGTGFDFSKADRVVFVEFDWVPGVNDQAADRTSHLTKMARGENVFAQYLVFKNSLDRVMLEANFEKRKAQQHV